MKIPMLRHALIAGALSIGSARLVAAQAPSAEFSQAQLPGWSFTPSVSLAGVFDSNVALAAPRADIGSTQSDRLIMVNPSGELTFLSPRTVFSGGYRGNLRRYMDVEGLNGFDQHASVSLRRLATRRLTWFLRDSYAKVATTDEAEVNGVPFSRTGSTLNNFSAGLDARLTQLTALSVGYDNTQVSFDRTDAFLTGGYVNALRTELSHQMAPRTSLGAEYAIRLANIDEGAREITFHDAGGTLRYQFGKHTKATVAGGLAYLMDRTFDDRRTGPYVRMGITHDAARATLGVSFGRSFVPSFGFGGANESQQFRAFIHMPLDKNRAYVQGSADWRRTNPLVADGLQLDTYRTRTTVGYSALRWLRLEGFYDFSRQDSVVTGGEVNRHRAGAQLVISQPMRIR